MTTNKVKLIAIVLFAISLIALSIFRTAPAAAAKADDAPPAWAERKCAVCHSPKAEKLFDPARPEAEQIQAILQGKKGVKPPNMPAFGVDKGEPKTPGFQKALTEDDAKALIAFMKKLRTPAN